jgi:murein DD-endopeptidase MepM/ murein hydrolase activator NlpD
VCERAIKQKLHSFSICILFVLFSTRIAALEIYGEAQPGAVMIGKTDPGSSVFLNEERIDVDSRGYFLIGFGRDAEGQQVVTVRLDDVVKTRKIDLKSRNYSVQRVDGVPQKTVTPGEDALKRIREEAAMVRAARDLVSPRRDFLQRFVAPASGRITGVYGSQRVYNGVPKRPHYGIDYAGPVGAPVIAPADGKVTLTHDDMYYSGGTLILDHGLGLSSTFIHLSEILVAEGQEVKQGEVIGKIGKGGRATGPHLDWRMNWLDQRVDPDLMLKVRLPENF